MILKTKLLLYCFPLLLSLFLFLLPVSVEASGNFINDYQSISSGDINTFSLNRNLDYTAVASSTFFPNTLPDGSKQIIYDPSYDATIDTLSFPLFSGNYFGFNHNLFSAYLPISITSSNSNVQILSYDIWAKFLGEKYYLGSSDWIQFHINYLNNYYSQFVEIGMDLHVKNSARKDFSNDMVIDGQLISGSGNGTYYSSTGNYFYEFSADPNFLIDDSYLDQIVNNRSGYSHITITWSNASYNTQYFEQEDISWLKNNYTKLNDLVSWSQTIANWLSDIKGTIVTWSTEICRHISLYGQGIIDKLDQLINGYSDNSVSSASDNFDQGASDLEDIENDLTDITNSSINSYTGTAFDTSVVSSLGSSLVYVVTWFTNFWNMGGIFTSILNVGLALSVAFFVLRLRGGSS